MNKILLFSTFQNITHILRTLKPELKKLSFKSMGLMTDEVNKGYEIFVVA